MMPLHVISHYHFVWSLPLLIILLICVGPEEANGLPNNLEIRNHGARYLNRDHTQSSIVPLSSSNGTEVLQKRARGPPPPEFSLDFLRTDGPVSFSAHSETEDEHDERAQSDLEGVSSPSPEQTTREKHFPLASLSLSSSSSHPNSGIYHMQGLPGSSKNHASALEETSWEKPQEKHQGVLTRSRTSLLQGIKDHTSTSHMFQTGHALRIGPPKFASSSRPIGSKTRSLQGIVRNSSNDEAAVMSEQPSTSDEHIESSPKRRRQRPPRTKEKKLANTLKTRAKVSADLIRSNEPPRPEVLARLIEDCKTHERMVQGFSGRFHEDMSTIEDGLQRINEANKKFKPRSGNEAKMLEKVTYYLRRIEQDRFKPDDKTIKWIKGTIQELKIRGYLSRENQRQQRLYDRIDKFLKYDE